MFDEIGWKLGNGFYRTFGEPPERADLEVMGEHMERLECPDKTLRAMAEERGVEYVPARPHP